MNTIELTQGGQREATFFFKIDEILNKQPGIRCIATACEKQCIRCNVNSQKLGRTRS